MQMTKEEQFYQKYFGKDPEKYYLIDKLQDYDVYMSLCEWFDTRPMDIDDGRNSLEKLLIKIIK